MREASISKKVLTLLGDSRDPALLSLFCPAYLRTLVPTVVDGLLRLKVDKRGWSQYKRHHPRPQRDPPPADLTGILRAFRSAGLPAVRATDEGYFIFVYFVIKEADADDEYFSHCD